MSHGRPLDQQVRVRLHDKLAIGESRDLAKLDSDRPDKEKIYSWKTYHNYVASCIRFVDWCHETYGCNSVRQCRKHTQDYINARSHLSAYTLKADVAALSKLYGEPGEQIARTPSRKREQITRSRGKVEYDRHINPDHWRDLYDFASATGMRRHELEYLKGGPDQIRKRDDGFYEIHIEKGKGGKERWSILCADSATVKKIVDRVRETPSDKHVFDRIPAAMDVHACRRTYAQRVYAAFAVDPSILTKKDFYYCRDGSHEKYQKVSAKIVTECLGHNRTSVAVAHYLR